MVKREIPKTITKRFKKNRSGEVTGHIWRARYFIDGQEYSKHFTRKIDAQNWLDEVTADIVKDEYIAPADQAITVDQWCDQWLLTQRANRVSTQRQAKADLQRIRAQFGDLPLKDVRPSMVKAWLGEMLQGEELAASTVSKYRRRLSQVMGAAVEDRLLARNPVTRATIVDADTEDEPFWYNTEQVWTLYDGYGDLGGAVLLGCFAGLRIGEVCGLRTSDVDWQRGVITPAVQWPAEPLKTKESRKPIPVPREFIDLLNTHVKPGSEWVLTDEVGQQVPPWRLQRLHRRVRPDDRARFHDFRHYFASMLIAQGANVIEVQHRMRHKKASITLDTYAHLMEDNAESTRSMVGDVIAARVVA
jgi:integrase